jgi:hypothetical protein
MNERSNTPRPVHFSRRAAQQRDELAALQLIELRSMPANQTRITRYRIGEAVSGGVGAIHNPPPQPESSPSETQTSSLGAGCPLPPRADIGPRGQSVGQAAHSPIAAACGHDPHRAGSSWRGVVLLCPCRLSKIR